MTGTIRQWAELKTSDFKRGKTERIALLPVAAVEQHGPHLPFGTDSFILEAIIAGLDGRMAKGTEILILPFQSVGDSTEHGDFPGTLTQEAETLIAGWTALGEKVSDSGIEKLAIVNSHGGQPQIVDIVAQRLRAECGMLVGRINTFLFGMPENLFSADELAFGFHGGEVETSMMLAIAPHLVDRKAARNFPSLARTLAKKNKSFGAEGPAGFAWQAQDLNPSGATGNASAADAKRGQALLVHLSAQLATALNEMAAFPMSHLKDRLK